MDDIQLVLTQRHAVAGERLTEVHVGYLVFNCLFQQCFPGFRILWHGENGHALLKDAEEDENGKCFDQRRAKG